jgi:hypothetical protein
MGFYLQNGHTHLIHGHILIGDPVAVCNHCDIPLLLYTLSSHAYFRTENRSFHHFCMMCNILRDDHGNVSNNIAFLCGIWVDSFVFYLKS